MMTAVAFLLFAGYANAQTDTDRVKFDYYPDANIYYNDLAKTYWYQDSASNTWQNAAKVPGTYSLDPTSRKITFYYNGRDAWKANAYHMKKYGSTYKPRKKSP